uniref:C2H2-type domain-containing protein n=1 Tax=Stomoxys calcitrans TaxID=35570 RepID=A0A1I8PA41_STOCA
MNDEFQKCFQMLNMEWEKRLQYICGKCWQHIWEFHQFQKSIIEAQKGLHLQVEASKEVEKVKIKSELNINQQEVQLMLHNAKELSASTDGSIKPTALTFVIKSEEPLDLNSDHEGLSPQDGQDHLTDEEMFLMKNEDYSSSDDMPLTSLGKTNLSSSNNKVSATKRSVEEFDELVALWRSSLECEICHQLVASYSQLKEHFSNFHASEGCFIMCCQLRLETRYNVENHIRYHNAPEHLRCDACRKSYRLKKYLRNHIKNVHTSKGVEKEANVIEKLEGKYWCCKCSKDFASDQHLKKHNRSVHKPKNFECNICEKSFMHADVLREHLVSHKGEKLHACSFCPKSFTWRSNYGEHMRKFHPHEWQKMQKEAAQNEAQRETLKGYRRETRGECMVYVCIYCTVEYDKRLTMLKHIKRCRRDGGTKETKMEFRLETRGESIVHICIYCSKEYEKRVSMQNHIRRWHTEHRPVELRNGYRREIREEGMVYVCSSCSQEYEKRYSIYSHISRCQGSDRPIEPKKGYRRETRGESMVYICNFCTKEYTKMKSVHYHLYNFHRDEASLAKEAPTISEPPVSGVQQQPIHSRRTRSSNTRIIGSNTNDVANVTSDDDTLSELKKEGEEDSLMTPIETNELKDENATQTYVKTEQFSADTNALVKKEMDDQEMSQDFKEATWETEKFIKSEEEFI